MQCVFVMPVYNEEGCIREVVARWTALARTIFGENDFRLLVVNDGSTDGTKAILDDLKTTEGNLVVVHQKNGGHGAAVLRAYQEALTLSTQYVFQTDSDDQFDPKDFSKLWQRRTESPMILGNRASRQDPLHRLIITFILRSLLSMFFGCRISDANIPFRLFKAEYLRSMLRGLPEQAPFAPNIFLSVLAAKDGKKLLNIPVEHFDRQTGKVSIVRWKLIKVCLRCVRELLDYRFSLPQRLRLLHANEN